jgi:hypothetical protein
VIPIGVEFVDVDGGVNCAPNILTPTNPPAGQINLDNTSTDTVSGSVTDCEVGTLYLHVFRGTDPHQPAFFSVSKALSTQNATWDFIVPETNFCLVSGPTTFSIVIADQPFDDNGLDPTKGYRAVTNNGKFDTATYVGTCP